MTETSKQTVNPTDNSKGFTLAEKWIIWGVFCLLIGLSTHFLIMPAMLIITIAIVRWRWETSVNVKLKNRALTLLLFLFGIGLSFWAVMLMIA